MRLIDADVLMETIRAHAYPLRAHFNSTDNGMFVLGIQQAVDNAPTVDAVPVVRCKNCKWFAEGKWCRNPNNDMVQGGTTSEWFCGDGKPKGGADDDDN